ncbi:MAG TPA: hypothetical protein VN578_25525 [Candidatus Binatia bacterium]|jgi:hypothetical protein|nr:hypothetical protein [Candidatus Binatia bacterium]
MTITEMSIDHYAQGSGATAPLLHGERSGGALPEPHCSTYSQWQLSTFNVQPSTKQP